MMCLTKVYPVVRGLFGSSNLRACAAMVLAAAAMQLPAPAAAETTDSQHVSAQQLKELLSNKAYAVIRSGHNYSVITVARPVSGDPELHENMADLFVPLEGSAEIVTGGELVGAKSIGPGEWMGGSIVKGTSRKVAQGDIFWIPAGTPHQVKLAPGQPPFRYVVVKVAK